MNCSTCGKLANVVIVNDKCLVCTANQLAAKGEEIRRLREALKQMIDEIHDYDPARKIIFEDYFKEPK